eukprot:7600694-Heterocapsa_arctica.AAC.1
MMYGDLLSSSGIFWPLAEVVDAHVSRQRAQRCSGVERHRHLHELLPLDVLFPLELLGVHVVVERADLDAFHLVSGRDGWGWNLVKAPERTALLAVLALALALHGW